MISEADIALQRHPPYVPWSVGDDPEDEPPDPNEEQPVLDSDATTS